MFIVICESIVIHCYVCADYSVSINIFSVYTMSACGSSLLFTYELSLKLRMNCSSALVYCACVHFVPCKTVLCHQYITVTD